MYDASFHFGRGCVLEQNVLVGRGTRIGNNTRITDSVIGKDCKIGQWSQTMGELEWKSVVIARICHEIFHRELNISI